MSSSSSSLPIILVRICRSGIKIDGNPPIIVRDNDQQIILMVFISGNQLVVEDCLHNRKERTNIFSLQTKWWMKISSQIQDMCVYAVKVQNKN